MWKMGTKELHVKQMYKYLGKQWLLILEINPIDGQIAKKKGYSPSIENSADSMYCTPDLMVP